MTSDAGRFRQAATALPPRVAVEMKDVVLRPPEQDQYGALHATMMKRYGASRASKTRRLLELEEIGDRKPSQFLRHLRNLASNQVTDDMLKTIWLSHLPHFIQPALAGREDISLDQLADIADVIRDATGNAAVMAPWVNVVSEEVNPSTSGQMQQMIASLTLAVQE